MSFLTMSLPLSKVMGETAKIQAEYLADEAAFEDAGREPGVEMWVVVKVDKDFSLKKIDLKELCAEEAYVFLETKDIVTDIGNWQNLGTKQASKHSSVRRNWHVDFWVGSLCDRTYKTVAAINHTCLKRKLELSDRHYVVEKGQRQEEGSETKEFVAYFSTAVYGLPQGSVVAGHGGSVEAFLRHNESPNPCVELFEIHSGVSEKVPLCLSSVSCGNSAFVLCDGKNVHILRLYASPTDKILADEVATKHLGSLRNEAVNEVLRNEVDVIEATDCRAPFWSALKDYEGITLGELAGIQPSGTTLFKVSGDPAATTLELTVVKLNEVSVGNAYLVVLGPHSFRYMSLETSPVFLQAAVAMAYMKMIFDKPRVVSAVPDHPDVLHYVRVVTVEGKYKTNIVFDEVQHSGKLIKRELLKSDRICFLHRHNHSYMWIGCAVPEGMKSFIALKIEYAKQTKLADSGYICAVVEGNEKGEFSKFSDLVKQPTRV